MELSRQKENPETCQGGITGECTNYPPNQSTSTPNTRKGEKTRTDKHGRSGRPAWRKGPGARLVFGGNDAAARVEADGHAIVAPLLPHILYLY